MKKLLVDHLGIGVSALCLVHCLLLPVVILFFPMLEQGAKGIDEHFHEILYFLIIGVSFLSFLPTYLRTKRVVFMLNPIIALTLMSVAHFGAEAGLFPISSLPEILLTSSGGIFLIITHFKNIKYCRQCKTKHHRPEA